MLNEDDAWSLEGSRRRDALLKEELVSRYVPFLARVLAPRGGLTLAILYGSRARGDYATWSDTDLLVCSPAFEGVRILDRTDILETERFSGAIEIVCYTPAEASMMLERCNPTMLDALNEGIVLHEDGRVLDQLREQFGRLKATGILTRVHDGERPYWKVS